jgi:voltage-gated potassium channel Kch
MLTPETEPQFTVSRSDAPSDLNDGSHDSHFLVCGLGSLGQFCVSVLKEFGVPVSAITIHRPESWEVTNLPDFLEELQIGDCRQPDILVKAGAQNCRAVLLTTSDERVNIEAAFAIRVLNPHVRLVVRSAKQSLNELLRQGLGNFVALEASQLPAPAFAIAALGSEIRGFINLDDYMLRVVKIPIDQTHRWCDRRLLHELNAPARRILSHIPEGSSLPTEFYQWEPDARIQSGDLVAYIEVTEGWTEFVTAPAADRISFKALNQRRLSWKRLRHYLSGHFFRQKLTEFWRSTAQQQTKRVATVVGVAIFSLLVCGTVILKFSNPQAPWLAAFYAAGVMLLGSYDTVFGIFSPTDTIPLWLRLMNLSYMLAGTASIAVLYALLTESLLAAKFQLPKKRPPVPLQDHVVLVGLGRVGRRVAAFLQHIKQPLVGVSTAPLEVGVLPSMPLIVGDLTSALSRVNLATAKSVVVATDDEMANLELGLMAHAANPDCALVIRTFDPRFSSSIDRLLPYAKVLSAYDLAAEAFVVSAFGENVLSLLRLNEQTVLVTEYTIAAGDTLNGRLLAEVAYGYGVVPILHQRSLKEQIHLMPSDDLRLDVGDRLVVLATINGLQQIERGEMLPRQWQVYVDKALSKDAIFAGATAIARISGCGINHARDVMNQLPTVLPIPLYKHQAQRLIRELGKAQVLAHMAR